MRAAAWCAALCAAKCAAFGVRPQTARAARHGARRAAPAAAGDAAVAAPAAPAAAGDAGVTELSGSFDGAVGDASQSLIQAVRDGYLKLRVDFDTTLGDATYTTLTSSMPFAKAVAYEWATDLALRNATLALYFPDAGSAASAQHQWKDKPLPPNTRFASFPRDKPQPGDAAFFVICPRATEADATSALVEAMTGGEATSPRPVVLLNPALVDMGTTGYGLAGRNLRNRLINVLEPAYYLRALDWGVLARNYPKKFSVWYEDADATDGYRYVQSFDTQPNGEVLEELYDELQPPSEGGGGPMGIFDAVGKFIENFQRM
ncbi:hypothetical protein M885DRAFT_541145 [Pelagophyceae sp. CCMP2097]|nr:hypothetical protein M885DRAFT_541145 [Pelagophyceae sp. CCMP2097]